MKKRFLITISGKVQGVFFRASAKNKAVELGLNGFIENIANGNVFMDIEGEEEDLNKMVDWCKAGPLLASVKKVLVEEVDVAGHQDFNINKH